MIRLVLLDAGPLGLVSLARSNEKAARCLTWLRGVLSDGARVLVPDTADFEVRREAVRVSRSPRYDLARRDEALRQIERLDKLAEEIGRLSVDTATWRRAAELWAQARSAGYPTADRAALDCDVILAAQAQLAAEGGAEVIVATTNVGHLARFVDARE